MSFQLESAAFQHNEPIPVRHSGDGEDVSPALSWSGVPSGTQEFALICDDPDAPTPQPWVHWVIYKIPGTVTGLPEGYPTDARVESPVTALQGLNSWLEGETIGFRGPLPPPGHGTHHYHFKLYALDSELDLPAEVDKSTLQQALSGRVLGEAELIGTFER